MRAIARSLVVILVALIAVPALAVSYTIATAVQLLAVTGFYMGGTEHPLSSPPDEPGFITGYMDLADDNYITPGTELTPGTRVAVVYPAEFFPVFGSTTFDDSVLVGRQNLNSCIREEACNDGDGDLDPIPQGPEDTFIIFGYSQSAVVASLVKRDLIANREGAPDDTRIVMAANPMRPNGGILGMGLEGLTIPGLGITFYGDTPTNSCDLGTCIPTDDTAQQYDLLGGDAVVVPWNLLAWANSGASYVLLHSDVPNVSPDDPRVIEQGTYGDTDYYMITAPRLPLFIPLETAGVPGPLLAVIDAPTRVLVEAGHYHGTSPGVPLGFQLLPETDPITLTLNLIVAVPVGIDDGLQEAGIGRLLGTDDVYRPFGVGGQAYSKADGSPVPDESAPPNVLESSPLNALEDSPETLTIEPQKTVETGLNNDKKADEFVNGDAPPADTLPEGTKPDPFGQLRESLKFDPPKPPSGLRPNGNGPLRQIVNALTGQRPEPTDAEAADPAA